MIESTTKDGVAVLAMRHGKANALDIDLCQALCGALDDAVAGGRRGGADRRRHGVPRRIRLVTGAFE